MGKTVELVGAFDRDHDGKLDVAERRAAREHVAQTRVNRGPGGPGVGRRGPGGREAQGTVQAGRRLSPSEAPVFPGVPLYEGSVLRTLFIEFEGKDWEQELEAFHGTDVEVPARLTVDGEVYEGVGVHFRGMSSYMMVSAGRKRSLNLSLDFVHPTQRLGGYRTLNLLNSHEDPSFLRTVLYYEIARAHIPAPKANLVRLVINGESWGIYVNAQQFDREFVRDWYGTVDGARWSVPGSPGGQGSLAFLGQELEAYRSIYQLKTRENLKSWVSLILLCQVLHETPMERLEGALQPLLDVDGVLKFLALENAFVNSDGYWIRTSDYNLYQDPHGRFHLVPHDGNETFSGAGGMGGPGGPPGGRGGRGFGPGGGGPGGGAGGSGVTLDPLVAINDARKPLLAKLLAVPVLRERYLGYLREIASVWLDWARLGPMAEAYHELIREEVEADTRKLDTDEAFLASLSGDGAEANAGEREGEGRLGMGMRIGRRTMSLREFAEKRRAFLLERTGQLRVAAESEVSGIGWEMAQTKSGGAR